MVKKLKKMETLPADINGKLFETDDGVSFQVLAGTYFPQESIGRANKKYLSNLRQGLLVSVSFYGKPVSVITVSGGVVRLDRVAIGNQEFDTATAISESLGVPETRQPMGMYLM